MEVARFLAVDGFLKVARFFEIGESDGVGRFSDGVDRFSEVEGFLEFAWFSAVEDKVIIFIKLYDLVFINNYILPIRFIISFSQLLNFIF